MSLWCREWLCFRDFVDSLFQPSLCFCFNVLSSRCLKNAEKIKSWNSWLEMLLHKTTLNFKVCIYCQGQSYTYQPYLFKTYSRFFISLPKPILDRRQWNKPYVAKSWWDSGGMVLAQGEGSVALGLHFPLLQPCTLTLPDYSVPSHHTPIHCTLLHHS